MRINLQAVSVIGVGVLLGAVIGAAEAGLRGVIGYGFMALVIGLVVVTKQDL